MRFLQSPSRIASELKSKTDKATEEVDAIVAARRLWMSVFNADTNKLREQLDTVLNGKTPADADLKALREALILAAQAVKPTDQPEIKVLSKTG